MTVYQRLIDRSDHCEQLALVSEDGNLRRFWHNASVGFRRRALALPIEEGNKEETHEEE